MMTGNSRSSTAAVVLTFAIVTLVVSVRPCVAGPVQQVFAFGDQTLDVGQTRWYVGAAWRADVPPYGKTLGGEPTGRFTDGNLTLDFITDYLGYRPLLPANRKPLVSKRGTSFATYGAGTSFGVNKGKTLSLERQISAFKVYAEKRKNNPNVKLDQALILLSVGQNDMIEAIASKGDAFAQKQITATTNLMARAAEDLFKISKSHKIVVFSIPPLGCLPAIRYAKKLSGGAKCYEPANVLAQGVNTALRIKLDRVRKQYGVKHLVQLNLYYAYTYKIFGRGFFKDKVTPCCEGITPLGRRFSCGRTVMEGGKRYNSTACAKPHEHVWWDWYNPTNAVNMRLAEEVWGGTQQYIFPQNLKSFASA